MGIITLLTKIKVKDFFFYFWKNISFFMSVALLLSLWCFCESKGSAEVIEMLLRHAPWLRGIEGLLVQIQWGCWPPSLPSFTMQGSKQYSLRVFYTTFLKGLQYYYFFFFCFYLFLMFVVCTLKPMLILSFSNFILVLFFVLGSESVSGCVPFVPVTQFLRCVYLCLTQDMMSV